MVFGAKRFRLALLMGIIHELELGAATCVAVRWVPASLGRNVQPFQ